MGGLLLKDTRHYVTSSPSLMNVRVTLYSGIHTALFSTEDAAFQRCEGSGMKTLAFINPLPLLEGSLPNSHLKETLK